MMNSEKPIMGMTDNPISLDAENQVSVEQIMVAQTAIPVEEPVPGKKADDARAIADLERYPGVRRELSQEQLEAREQRRVELQDTFTYDDYKVARKEMHSGLHDPSIMIRSRSITFNQPCITSLEGVSYVRLYFSEELGRLAIRPVAKNTPHALRWCAESNGKRKPRTVTCPDLIEWFYKTMGWQKNTRYRVLGYLIEVEGEMIYVFDFKYPKLFNERQRDEDGNLLPVDRKGYYPEELKKTFTVPVDEIDRSMAVKETNGLISAAMLIGADKLPKQRMDEKEEESDDKAAPKPVDTAREANVRDEVLWDNQTPTAGPQTLPVGLPASSSPAYGVFA